MWILGHNTKSVPISIVYAGTGWDKAVFLDRLPSASKQFITTRQKAHLKASFRKKIGQEWFLSSKPEVPLFQCSSCVLDLVKCCHQVLLLHSLYEYLPFEYCRWLLISRMQMTDGGEKRKIIEHLPYPWLYFVMSYYSINYSEGN